MINNDIMLFINFISHMLIFIGALYVALHNRQLPKWHITPLWYVGLSSFSCAIAIMCQWGLGSTFPLSYSSIGSITELALDISLASIAIIFLCITLKKDITNSAYRSKN